MSPNFPPLIDYAGGGSAIEWTKTLDEVLKLDFDTVIPGHGPGRILTAEFFWQDFQRQRGWTA